jgi:hypothetical protein
MINSPDFSHQYILWGYWIILNKDYSPSLEEVEEFIFKQTFVNQLKVSLRKRDDLWVLGHYLASSCIMFVVVLVSLRTWWFVSSSRALLSLLHYVRSSSPSYYYVLLISSVVRSGISRFSQHRWTKWHFVLSFPVRLISIEKSTLYALQERKKEELPAVLYRYDARSFDDSNHEITNDREWTVKVERGAPKLWKSKASLFQPYSIRLSLK